jgi:hypothetical protein
MSDPIAFASATPALGLPLLIAGQAQKEFFVNEALCVLDALNARAVIASQPAPPATPVAGASFRITAPATGAWAGQEDRIAVMIGGDWRFIAPAEGWLLFDRAAGQLVVYRTQWQPAAVVAAPAGGSVVDSEARAALTSLIVALQSLGVLGASPA